MPSCLPQSSLKSLLNPPEQVLPKKKGLKAKIGNNIKDWKNLKDLARRASIGIRRMSMRTRDLRVFRATAPKRGVADDSSPPPSRPDSVSPHPTDSVVVVASPLVMAARRSPVALPGDAQRGSEDEVKVPSSHSSLAEYVSPVPSLPHSVPPSLRAPRVPFQ